MTGSGGTARQAYEAQAQRCRQELAALDRRGALLANLRTLAFLGFLALLLLVIFGQLGRVWVAASLGSLVVFVGLVIVHARVIHVEARTKVRLSLNERGLARLDGGWHKFPQTGAALLPENHVYAGDLDVLGQGSLFQRIDDTGTAAGEAQLAKWLLEPPSSLDEARARQGAVRELGPQLDFRQALVTEARMAGEEKADPAKFIAWAESPSALDGIAWSWPVAHVLPALTIAAMVAAWLDLLPGLVFWVGVGLQIIVVALTRKPLGRMWEALAIGERGFVRFEETFVAIDAQKFEHPLLRTLQAGIQREGPPVSERLGRFARLLGFAELKQSGQLHPIINALTLWDIHVLFRIETWRKRDGAGVRKWFEALAQLEALSSFATLTFEKPEWAFAELSDGPLTFEAKQLGHPLLAQPVMNDVALPGPGQALVITGSNMSGKTTLMRAMGLNAVMALAGLPVCARGLKISNVRVLTSMRVADSLERGVSYFYAEVQRIKTLLDMTKQHRAQCVFLLDELFMGTNTRERQIASKQLMSMLLETGASGAVTTHDLTLCELEKELPGKVRNVHFRDQIVGGEMTFDYRLREGVVQTTNALEVLKRAGVPVG